jgi:hypothetical protein
MLHLAAPVVMAQSEGSEQVKEAAKVNKVKPAKKQSAKGTQESDQPQKASFIELGLSGNASKTDLATSYQRWTPGMHLNLQLYQKKRFNGSFNISYGSVISQNLRPDYVEEMAENAAPVNYVNTSFFTINYGLQLNLLKKERYRLFVGQGVGVIKIYPKDIEGNNLAQASRTRASNESYSNVSIFLPTQLGFNYFLNNGYGLGLTATWLNPATDYVDNLSQLGTKAGNDNILSYRFSLLVPLKTKLKEQQ